MRLLTSDHRVVLGIVRLSGPPPPPGLFEGMRWERVAEVAFANNLASLLHHRLTAGGRDAGHSWPKPPQAVLEFLRRESWLALAQTHPLHAAFDAIAPELASRGLAVMPLKGLLFSRTLYPDVATRPMTDVDLLARPSDLEAIGGLFERRGYAPKSPPVRPATQAEMFERRWEARVGPYRVLFEVHRALGQPTRYRVDDEGLWTRSVPISRYGGEGWPAGMRALSPEDNLLHLCLHQSNHMFNELDLRGVLDLHEVVSRWAPDWGTVLERARSWGVLTALHLALRTAQHLFGTGVPPFVIEQSRPPSLRRAWLEAFIDVEGLGLYRYERHPSWLVRATVGFPLMDRLADRARFARYYAGLRVRDVLATWRGR